MTEHTLSVNGAVLKTQSVFPVIDPATGESFAACPRPTLEQIDEAINSAQNAFFSWSALSQIERQDLIRICGDRLDKKADEIAALLTKEQGKTLKEAKREVAGLGYYFRLTAGMEIPEEVIEDTDDRLIKVVHKPLGVVAAISAWNYPLLLAAWKIAPAVSVGNTIVIKPSPDTPLSTMAMVNVLAEVLPPGVVNVVTGHEEEGQYLVTHPKVRKVTFTGSVPVGKIINSHAASDLKRITLELGGNDAAIILKDCDPKAIAPGIFWSAFSNNGQTCVAIKRVYVHEDIHDELVSEVTKIAQQVKLGAGTDPAAKLGPVCNAGQQKRVHDLVEDARTNGATVHCGGAMPEGPGYFYPPTIVSGVNEGVRLVDEEQFGPALPFIRYKDLDEAIASANNSDFGLGGSIWSKDLDFGASLLPRLDCGTAWLNTHADFCMTAPFGGAKDSGIDVENGIDGLRSFTQKQVLSMKK